MAKLINLDSLAPKTATAPVAPAPVLPPFQYTATLEPSTEDGVIGTLVVRLPISKGLIRTSEKGGMVMLGGTNGWAGGANTPIVGTDGQPLTILGHAVSITAAAGLRVKVGK